MTFYDGPAFQERDERIVGNTETYAVEKRRSTRTTRSSCSATSAFPTGRRCSW
ncbi:MAG: hypothetical protein WKF75_04345 [Singulisphaera sp.]